MFAACKQEMRRNGDGRRGRYLNSWTLHPLNVNLQIVGLYMLQIVGLYILQIVGLYILQIVGLYILQIVGYISYRL